MSWQDREGGDLRSPGKTAKRATCEVPARPRRWRPARSIQDLATQRRAPPCTRGCRPRFAPRAACILAALPLGSPRLAARVERMRRSRNQRLEFAMPVFSAKATIAGDSQGAARPLSGCRGRALTRRGPCARELRASERAAHDRWGDACGCRGAAPAMTSLGQPPPLTPERATLTVLPKPPRSPPSHVLPKPPRSPPSHVLPKPPRSPPSQVLPKPPRSPPSRSSGDLPGRHLHRPCRAFAGRPLHGLAATSQVATFTGPAGTSQGRHLHGLAGASQVATSETPPGAYDLRTIFCFASPMRWTSCFASRSRSGCTFFCGGRNMPRRWGLMSASFFIAREMPFVSFTAA